MTKRQSICVSISELPKHYNTLILNNIVNRNMRRSKIGFLKENTIRNRMIFCL